jgi:hypothetical protein
VFSALNYDEKEDEKFNLHANCPLFRHMETLNAELGIKK